MDVIKMEATKKGVVFHVFFTTEELKRFVGIDYDYMREEVFKMAISKLKETEG